VLCIWKNLTSSTILKNRQDACSTRKFTLCGTGILPVHKKLIENCATSQKNATNFFNMKIKAIHHVAIICSDYEASKKFYVEVLGCSIIKETFRSERNSYKLDLRVGNGDTIELFSFPHPPKRVNNPEACGLRHLAFAVEDIEASVAYLKSQQVEVEDIRLDEIREKRFTFFRDPDNLPLEIYEI
jgi:glyoxylase I family protein